MSKDNMSEDDYLKKHLAGADKQTNKPPTQIHPEVITTNISDLKYLSFDIKTLPCGEFYPIGASLMVRPASVIEIQAYSVVDDNSLHDILDKMNFMLQSCVRIKYADGSMGSYLDIKDSDRFYIIFLIRELTFQQGNDLISTAICSEDKSEVSIELKRANFRFRKVDEKLKRFYNLDINAYRFKLKNGQEYDVSPPTIGIQKAFSDYIIKENALGKDQNLSFVKIIPFLLPNRTSITYDGIKAKLAEFESLDDMSFQFLNNAIDKLKLGIEELAKKCGACGQEVRTNMTFPNGASGIFVIQDAFSLYIEE